MLEHRRDDRHAGPPPPRHRDGRAGRGRAARPRAHRRRRDPAPQRRARRDRRPRPAPTTPPRSACSSATAGSSPSSRACPRPRDALAPLAPSAATAHRRERHRTTLHRLLERGSGPMAAQRASIAVSVTRAGLTLATAFALTRVFAGRSWLFVMVLAAVAPPVFLGWAQTPPLAPARPARGRRRRRRLARGARRRSDDHRARRPDPRDARRARRTRWAARRTRCAPRSCRSRRSGSALVLAFVGVFVAAALTTGSRRRSTRRSVRSRRASRCSSSIAAVGGGGWVAPTALYALAVARLPARARAARSRRPAHVVPREPAARVAHRGRRRARSARSRSSLSLVVGPSVPGAGGSPLLDYRALGRGSSEGNLLSAPPPILQHPGQAHARAGAGAVHRAAPRAPRTGA